jgi:hypothetical protein
MDTIYSSYDGLREGVAFLLVDEQRDVLLEWQLYLDNNITDAFFPSGPIETSPH